MSPNALNRHACFAAASTRQVETCAAKRAEEGEGAGLGNL